MIYFIKLFVSILIIGLFIYSKIAVYEGNLFPKFKKIFKIIKSIIEPLLAFLSHIIKPYKIGNNLSIDIAQLVLLVIFLLIFRL